MLESTQPQAAKPRASTTVCTRSLRFSNPTSPSQCCASWVEPALNTQADSLPLFSKAMLSSCSSSAWGRAPHIHGGTKAGFVQGAVWRAAAHLQFPPWYSSERIWWLTQEMDAEERISRPLFQQGFLFLKVDTVFLPKKKKKMKSW